MAMMIVMSAVSTMMTLMICDVCDVHCGFDMTVMPMVYMIALMIVIFHSVRDVIEDPDVCYV
jgi:hypothetical protein